MSTNDAASLRLTVLGPVRAWRAQQELPLGPPQQRALLAALLLRRGRSAAISELVDAIWGQNSPSGAVTVLRTYVSRLRKVLEPDRSSRAAPQVIVSAADGYLVDVPEDCLDLGVFERRVAEAKRLRAGGDLAAAAELLHAAVEVWDGKPLAGIPGPLAEAERYRLDEQRLSALETRTDLDLQLGRHEEVAAELATPAREHPLRERLCELLMLALYRCGRQAEALAVHRELRDTLRKELGIEPSPRVLDLHARIVAADPSLRAPVPPEQSAAPAPSPGTPPAAARVRPAQLPADLPVFTGRSSELALTDALLPAGGERPTAVVISAIGGMAGVGKTTLAVHWAHGIAHHFPDGQLYVNLRGFDPTGSAMPADEAVHTFLDALGVPPAQMPGRPDTRVALYRSLTAERRVLLLLDNARDTAQVRPLLPSGPGCLAIITSRNQLTGLIASDGAHPLTLDPLPPDEARDLVARRIGAARMTAEPEASDEIIARCARLPLALAVVAARAATHPRFPLQAVADELCAGHGSLDAFTGGDISTDLRAVFSWSYQALSAPAARLFRLLGTHPGKDVGAPAAAALAGLPLRETRALLGELTRAHLLTEHFPGRYSFHDLLHIYAGERASCEEDATALHQAAERVLTWYLHTAEAASRFITPARPRIPLVPLPPDCRPLTFTMYDEALEWCSTERPHLIAAVNCAAASGRPGLAWRLPAALWGFFYLRSHTNDWAACNRAGLAATRAAGDREGEAECLTGLASALAVDGRYEQAIDHYEQALAVLGELGDTRRTARISNNLGDVLMRAGRADEALSYLEKALETAESDWSTSICLNNLGEAYLHLGRLDEARARLEEALEILRATDNRWVEGIALDLLGTVHHRLRRHDDAVEHYQLALRAHRDTGNRYAEAHSISHLAEAHLARGEPDAARAGCEQALGLLEEFNHPDAAEIRHKLHATEGEDVRGTAEFRGTVE